MTTSTLPGHEPPGTLDPPLLPDWYMPAPMAGTPRLHGWRRVVAWLIVLSLVAVVASGLCSTYGDVVVA